MSAKSSTDRQVRRAGAYWRLLVHEVIPGQFMNGAAHNVYSHQRDAVRHFEVRAGVGDYPTKDEESVTVLPGTEFDEFVCGRWLHVEQMDSGVWWMDVGGVTLWVRVDRDGRPKSVTVYSPGNYDNPRNGCTYEIDGELSAVSR